MRWVLLLVVGCGRIDFDAHRDAADASVPIDAAAITYAQTVIGQSFSGSLHTFSFTPMKTGDAVLLQLGCFGNAMAPSVTIAAPGWTFDPVGALQAGPQQFAQTVAAIVPNTDPVTVTITWTGISCGNGGSIGDELANVDPAGGAITFDAHAEMSGIGDCTASVTTGHDNDAIWAGCQSNSEITSVGAGYTKGADDGGDWTELKLTTDPVGTDENASFGNTTGQGFTISVVSVEPS